MNPAAITLTISLLVSISDESTGQPMVSFSESDILSATGGSDTDPVVYCPLQNGDGIYLDTEPGVDALIYLESSGASTLLATETELKDILPGAPTRLTFVDACLSSNDDIFILMQDSTLVTREQYLLLLKYNELMFPPFDSPELLATFFATDNNRALLECDNVNGNLLLYHNTDNPSLDDSIEFGSHGLYTIPQTLNPPAIPSDFEYLVSNKTLLTAIVDDSIIGTEELGFTSFVPTANNEIFLAHSFTSLGGENHDGQILRYRSGVPEVLISKSDLLDSLNLELGTDRPLSSPIGDLHLLVCPNNLLFMFEDIPDSELQPGGVNEGFDAFESVFVFDLQSSVELLGVIATHTELKSLYPAGTFSPPVISLALTNAKPSIDGEGTLFFPFTNRNEQVVKIVPPESLRSASISDWKVFITP